MRAIRTLLVDDEPLANAGLRALLAGHPDLTIVGEAQSGQDAIQQITGLHPDLIFLDVQMPRLDGFEVLRTAMRRMPEGPIPQVIFVTAYDEFAVKAFEVRALHYLLKPVDDARLREALRRARETLQARWRDPSSDTLERMMRALLDEHAAGRIGRENRTREYLARIVVTIGARAVPIEVGDIDWIGARDYCAELHTRGSAYVIRESLASLEEQLNPAAFTRIHRSSMVNLSRVTEVQRRAVRGTTVVLADGTRLAVSRSRRSRLVELLGSRR
jgi:two-component system LytT family response regulator